MADQQKCINTFPVRGTTNSGDSEPSRSVPPEEQEPPVRKGLIFTNPDRISRIPRVKRLRRHARRHASLVGINRRNSLPASNQSAGAPRTDIPTSQENVLKIIIPEASSAQVSNIQVEPTPGDEPDVEVSSPSSTSSVATIQIAPANTKHMSWEIITQ